MNWAPTIKYPILADTDTVNGRKQKQKNYQPITSAIYIKCRMFLPVVPLLFGQQVFYLDSVVVTQHSVMRCFLHSSTLLAFLFELLKSSVAMQEQMLGGKGFLVIGYLLEKVTPLFSFVFLIPTYNLDWLKLKCVIFMLLAAPNRITKITFSK